MVAGKGRAWQGRREIIVYPRVRFVGLGVLERFGYAHNPHVMYNEKNICDNIIDTLLNIEDKTKDTLKSRIDLTHLGIRSNLQVKNDGA